MPMNLWKNLQQTRSWKHVCVFAQLAATIALWVALLNLAAGSATEVKVTVRGVVFNSLGGMGLEDDAGRSYALRGMATSAFKGRQVYATGFVKREHGALSMRVVTMEAVDAPPLPGALRLGEEAGSTERNSEQGRMPVSDGCDFQG